MKKNKQLISIFLFLWLFHAGFAQDCSQFPADCPQSMENTKDSMICIQDLIVPREINMQNKVRALIGDMMDQLARSKNWQAYEFSEFADHVANPTNDAAGNPLPLPYPLRRPHEFALSYILITNQDSLNAWRQWHNTELKDQVDGVVAKYNMSANDDAFQARIKTYMDSANYFMQLREKYYSDHSAEYQKALLADDKATINKIERNTKSFENKSNFWIEKATKARDNQLAPADVTEKDLQASIREHTVRFRNASMIRVKFKLNPRLISLHLSESMTMTRPVHLTGASQGFLLHNKDPYEKAIHDLDQFERSTDLGVLLLGSWKQQNAVEGTYSPEFALNPKNMDNYSSKSIQSDQVQAIAIFVEGNPENINTFFSALNLEKLNSLFTSQVH